MYRGERYLFLALMVVEMDEVVFVVMVVATVLSLSFPTLHLRFDRDARD